MRPKQLRNIHVFSEGLELAQSDLVDAVVISTPPVSHESLGLACLAAGKHVLCEKPLATSSEACQRLVDAAQQFGVCLATGFNLRYTPAAQLARELLDKGAIGELDHIRAFHGHPGGQEFKNHWICDSAVSGGGALMDNGIHLIDLTRYFLGNVEQVVGYATDHTWEKDGCEDNGFLLLKNSEGRVATLQASWTEWRGYGYRLEIYGTHGFIRFGYPPLYLFHGRRSPDGRITIKRHFFPLYQVQERLRGWQWSLVKTLVQDLNGWAEAIANGSEAPIGGFDGLEAVRIAQSVKLLPRHQPQTSRIA